MIIRRLTVLMLAVSLASCSSSDRDHAEITGARASATPSVLASPAATAMAAPTEASPENAVETVVEPGGTPTSLLEETANFEIYVIGADGSHERKMCGRR
jgi:hypothetical protein